ncbi:MAG: hypothetical protein SWY16_21145 [Cyanobacteriota bacterium]|nr:hypothetical protein [Cyanobacteriota bacterium]
MNDRVYPIQNPLGFVEPPQKTEAIRRGFDISGVNTERFEFCLSTTRMQSFNRRRSTMLSRKKVINLFIKYYINEDRNNVRSVLFNQSSSSDFSDDLCALEPSRPIDPELVAKKERDGSIDALQKRQSYVMKDRIEAIDERLKLGGHSFLTEKEIHLIRKNWPSIYQLVREFVGENTGGENFKLPERSQSEPEFLR